MSLALWFTRNWADTQQNTHPDVAPLELPGTPRELQPRVVELIRGLPRWRVVESDEDAHVIKATRRTLVFRFVDDVTVRLSPSGNGSLVQARSQSRVGQGDLGQNRRNLLYLFKHLRALGKS